MKQHSLRKERLEEVHAIAANGPNLTKSCYQRRN